jgi:NADPH:quinone reductase-like Zn-dependent oxidoreductase
MLVDLVGDGALRPPIAATYSLSTFVEAQRRFLEKRHVGKVVVTVPRP